MAISPMAGTERSSPFSQLVPAQNQPVPFHTTQPLKSPETPQRADETVRERPENRNSRPREDGLGERVDVMA